MHLDINKNGSYTRTLLRTSYREDGKVKKKTIANLSDCSLEAIEAIQFGLKYYQKHLEGKLVDLDESPFLHGKSAGAVFALVEIAKRIGLIKVLGNDKNGKLALWQIISRILDQGSRLSSVRLHQSYLLSTAIDLKSGFTEDNLYENLDWIARNQSKIEQGLFKERHGNKKVELLLYDVTSSYLEGNFNAFASYGYNRDGKKSKMQIVIGQVCDKEGFPISVQVFSGNTSDPKTFYDQIKKSIETFNCTHITFVGDRGMIKSAQKKELSEANLNYITALTKREINTLEKKRIIQLEMFDENICEIEHESIRYLLRNNPVRSDEIKNSRASKERSIEQTLKIINEYLLKHKRAKPETGLKNIEKKIAKLNCTWLTAKIDNRKVLIIRDEEKLKEISRLDGCYVITTDLPKGRMSAKDVHCNYKNLAKVERAFRESKTGHLEVRPIHVRKENSTRGHVFVVMCAYLIRMVLSKYWVDLNITVEEGLKSLSTISSVILTDAQGIKVEKIPRPTGISEELLKKMNYCLPEVVVSKNINVDTRKKLNDNRK